MEEKKYINIDNMATRLCQILKDARESMVDDENKESLKQRKAEGRYKPTKAEWAATIREHRRYKEQLKKKGDIK